ncbi:MAG TPA: hypothetical protein VJG66_04030 [Patescibacteria group bacterium]|nr:hypothetical protein [Patescibacteria group bacterium]
MAQDTLNVKILSPTQTIFEGEAVSVSSVNTEGKFDILPYHANFITLVQKKPIFLRIKKQNEKQQALPAKALEQFFGSNIQELKYEFDMAIIYSKDNAVKIYTNIQPQF